MQGKGIYEKNDSNYLGHHQQYSEPKESFKAVMQVIQQTFKDRSISMCDAGCASGAFLHYAYQNLNLKRSVGFDISDQLIAQAKEIVPQAEFYIDSILEPQHVKGQQFDLVVCLGTLSIFDEILQPLQALHALVAPGGLLISCDLVNDYPIDVMTRFKDANIEEGSWRCAFNVRSKRSYEKIYQKIDSQGQLFFTDFEMPFALPKTDNVLRAWTIQTEEKAHQLRVGTGQLLNYKIIHFKKSTI